MKIYLFLISALVLFVFSCDKNKLQVKEEPDNILFSNLPNPISESTVRYYNVENHTVCQVDVPIPTDSSTAISIDVDKDSNIDFIFNLSHNYWNPTQYCGHCSIYEYQITIKGVNINDAVAIYNQSQTTRFYAENDTVFNEISWANSTILIMEGGCMRPTFLLEDEYIAFKHNNMLGWIKLKDESNNGISIENYAINLTENKPIFAGQTE